MRKINLTDPFTGYAFEALEDETNGSLLFANPLASEMQCMQLNSNGQYEIAKNVFEPIETVTIKQAADLSNVNYTAIYNACKRGRLPFATLPNGEKVIVKSELEKYNETKSVGRPKKEKQCLEE